MQQIQLADVQELIAETLAVDTDKVVLDAHLNDDLGADSLDITTLVMDIEREFNISFDDESVFNEVTVKRAIELINEQLAQNN